MKRFLIQWVDQHGKVWTVGGPNGVEGHTMKDVASLFWSMFSNPRGIVPVKVTIEEMK